MIQVAGQSFPDLKHECPVCGMKASDPADIVTCMAIHRAFKPAGPSWRELKDIRKAAKMGTAEKMSTKEKPIFLVNQLSDREKAVFFLGMVRAFKAGKWPKHFSKEDRSQWAARECVAKQILSGGAFNPLHVWALKETVDDELGVEVLL